MMDEGVSISTFANRDDTQPIIRPGAKTQLSTTIEDNTSLVLSSDDEFSQADSNHGPGGSKAGGTSDTRRGLRGAWHKRTQSLQDRMMEK